MILAARAKVHPKGRPDVLKRGVGGLSVHLPGVPHGSRGRGGVRVSGGVRLHEQQAWRGFPDLGGWPGWRVGWAEERGRQHVGEG